MAKCNQLTPLPFKGFNTPEALTVKLYSTTTEPYLPAFRAFVRCSIMCLTWKPQNSSKNIKQ